MLGSGCERAMMIDAAPPFSLESARRRDQAADRPNRPDLALPARPRPGISHTEHTAHTFQTCLVPTPHHARVAPDSVSPDPTMDRYNPRLGSTSPLPWLLLGAVLLAWATFDGTAASSQFLLAVSNFEYFCMGALGLYLAARGIIPSSREGPPAWALSGLAAGVGGVFVRGLGWYATTAGGFRLMPACYYASLVRCRTRRVRTRPVELTCFFCQVSTFLDLVFAVELAVEFKRACVGG